MNTMLAGGSSFADPSVQGPVAYADQMVLDHPGLTAATLRADAVLAVGRLVDQLIGRA